MSLWPSIGLWLNKEGPKILNQKLSDKELRQCLHCLELDCSVREQCRDKATKPNIETTLQP